MFAGQRRSADARPGRRRRAVVDHHRRVGALPRSAVPRTQPTPPPGHITAEDHTHVKLTAVTRAVLQLQYEAARLPIGVLDGWVLGRYLPETSALRLPFGRVLGSLDTAAGRLLADQTLQQRGAALRQRGAARTATALLEDDAPRPGGLAWGQLTAAHRNPPAGVNQARRDHRAAIAEDLRDGRVDQRRVTAQAEARADTGRDFARAAARDRLRGVEARRSAERTRVWP